MPFLKTLPCTAIILTCWVSSAFGQRYEPTRPGQSIGYKAPPLDSLAAVTRHRYEPTRPRSSIETRRERPMQPRPSINGGVRYEPTRPRGRENVRSESHGWTQAHRRYDQLASAHDHYRQASSRYREYQEAKKKHGKLRKVGKVAFMPVKFVFKLSKKAVSKATFGWLPSP